MNRSPLKRLFADKLLFDVPIVAVYDAENFELPPIVADAVFAGE